MYIDFENAFFASKFYMLLFFLYIYMHGLIFLCYTYGKFNVSVYMTFILNIITQS